MIKDRAILYLAFAQTLVWAGLYYVFPALLVRWEESLDWSKTDLTAAITLAVFLSAFASPLAGRLIDTGKGPIMMAGSTILGGGCLFSLAYIDTLRQFYIVWGLIGITLAGCLYEPCFALVTRARGEVAKKSIILITLIAGFASSISFPVAHSLSEGFGWRVTVQIFAGIVIVFATPIMWKGAKAMEQGNKGGQIRSEKEKSKRSVFLKTQVFWLLGLGFACAAVLHGVALHHLLPILYDRGIHPDVAVTAAAFIGPMQVMGRLAMMAMERHVSNHDIAIGCFIGMGGSALLLLASGSTPALLVGFVILFGGSYGVVSIIRPVIARLILGEEHFGAKSGALALLYLAGGASAPFLGSLIWGIGGYQLVLSMLGILAVVGLLLYTLAYKFSQ